MSEFPPEGVESEFSSPSVPVDLDERAAPAVERAAVAPESASDLRKSAEEFGAEWIERIDVDSIDDELLKLIPFQFARANVLLPLGRVGDEALIVTANPDSAQAAADDLRLIFKAPIKFAFAPFDETLKAINESYDLSAQGASDVVEDINLSEKGVDELARSIPEDLLSSSSQAPVIRLVNSLLVEAAKEKASDIHIEPFEKEMLIRYRIDGSLRNVARPTSKLQSLILSRVKIMADMDIAEKRLPQDGRIKALAAGKEIDIRVSSIPTAHGERIVMRLLDKSSVYLGLDQLGMAPDLKRVFGELIQSPHGIILVAGPTGSGKTTTLYAAVSQINRPELNIMTVEDPIEYQLPGIGQMQVNSRIGLSFASGLRSILRQDPDVIMIGEIRDQETARIAVQASLTGHLVFSTIHTNDAAGTATRLIDIGIEPFLISSALIGALGQRLVRSLCRGCRQGKRATTEDLIQLGLSETEIDRYALRERIENATIYSPVGCGRCSGSGFRGRTGLFELLKIDEEARSQIVRSIDARKMTQSAIERGLIPMRVAGAIAVLEGRTSKEEVVRVTADSA